MDELLNTLAPVAAVVGALLAAVILAALLRRIAARTLRKVPAIQGASRRALNPVRLVLAIVGVRIALGVTASDTSWFPPVDYALVLALIGAVAWLIVSLLLVVEAVALRKYGKDAADHGRMRRLKTQIMLARRVGVAGVITLALASVLLTIPEVRALGAGILASAGLISIVAGLAVQSSLANVFAGVQLAFTDALRIDDTVFVEDQLGTVEEITMTYVVVKVWDDRRIILPSTYFTTTPFENWTRSRSELLGTVDLDLDWRVPIESMRAHLVAVLDDTTLWDGRTSTLQITQATDGMVRARVLVSAADNDALWDLKCLIRESMVVFLQTHHRDALPRQRWEAVHAEAAFTD
ncbi:MULTISPECIES: mechanosensitive ion channel family protein [unclassified Arthrobacter]|uniref:mechanosensitive ion channel family protein n=1 Tax=unclassified Arthrobacter TaxID=235627 RepID=UPI00149292CE|nr:MULTISPECIES: mechanosensitive ion channel domain-containing protein [unclassified Arthrobacter]MBE0009202.1 potassium transporter KefA [Arthrobacter sp. AET 35A]NOJ62988.1 mechanosensitive ion channel [Arthrobacter sp. 147(2020)]